MPENFFILLKDGSKEKVNLNDVFEVYSSQKKGYEKFLAKEISGTKPEKCNFCKFCDWQEICGGRLEKKAS